MKFVPVNEVPKSRLGGKYQLKHYLDEFMKMNVKIVKVDLHEHEYKHPKYAHSGLSTSVKRFGYPIDVHMRNNEIYLVRRDM